jgi:hypothetical protein
MSWRSLKQLQTVWSHWQTFPQNSPYSFLRDTKFSACPVGGFPRAPYEAAPSTASSSVDRHPVNFRLQMQPVSWNCKYHFRCDLPLGGSVPNFVRKCRWRSTINLFTWKSRTHNGLCSPLIAIFLSYLLVDDSETNAGKINSESLPSKAHLSQQDTLIRFRIINYRNPEQLFDLLCIFMPFSHSGWSYTVQAADLISEYLSYRKLLHDTRALFNTLRRGHCSCIIHSERLKTAMHPKLYCRAPQWFRLTHYLVNVWLGSKLF